MTVLSLEASKKVHALIGDYETENIWNVKRQDGTPYIEGKINTLDSYPMPTFAELIRVLPRIGEKKYKGKLYCYDCGSEVGKPLMVGDLIQIGTGTCTCSRQFENNWPWYVEMAQEFVAYYMNAPTEPEGMKAVEEYLMKLI